MKSGQEFVGYDSCCVCVGVPLPHPTDTETEAYRLTHTPGGEACASS